MERHEFCDDCPGCKPAIVNTETGEVYSPESPIMVAVNLVWKNDTTYQERKAFIDITYHNSRKYEDVVRANSVVEKIQAAINKVEG